MTTGSQSLAENLILVKYFGHRSPEQCKSFSFTVENNLHASTKILPQYLILVNTVILRIKLLFWSKSYARLGWWTGEVCLPKGKK